MKGLPRGTQALRLCQTTAAPSLSELPSGAVTCSTEEHDVQNGAGHLDIPTDPVSQEESALGDVKIEQICNDIRLYGLWAI